MKHKITMQFDDFMRVVHENARVRAENIAISKQNMEKVAAGVSVRGVR